MDFSQIFRIVNLAIGVGMILGGVGKIFSFGFQDIILGAYAILFGLVTGALEFQIPPPVARYASFYFSLLGRGVFYIFIGSVLLGEHWYNIVPGAIVGLAGVGYVVLEFVPSVEPPSNMREAEGGWGAEQV